MHLKGILILLMVIMLAACVTTKTGVFSSKYDKDKTVGHQVMIAIEYLKENDPERAIFFLKEAMELDDKSPRVHEVMGLALEKIQEYEIADKHFKKMLRYDSEYSAGRANYGFYLARRERHEEAYKHLKIVSKDIYYPNRAFVYMNLALSAKKLGKFQEVGPAYQKALALNSSLAAALLELSTITFDNKDYPGAQKYLDDYRSKVEIPDARALLLGIKLARIFEDQDREASDVLYLRNHFPKSSEYLEYIRTLRDKK